MTEEKANGGSFQPPLPPPFPGMAPEPAPKPASNQEPVAAAVPPEPVAVVTGKAAPPAKKAKAPRKTRKKTTQKGAGLRVRTKGPYPINLHVINIMISPSAVVEVPDHPYVRRQLELGSLELIDS